MYEQLFERNYGIFTSEEQQRIRDARVVIIGCGGIGGVVATALARSGMEHFILYDYDVYSPSNINRQVTCFTDTMGFNKAECVADSLLRINPEIEVTVHTEALRPDEMADAIRMGDVFIPAADEWPLSIAALGLAKELGKPAIMAYPVGALARVSTFLPTSPYAAECLVMPYKAPYEGLKAFMNNPDHRRILHYYCTEGSWRKDWFDDWCESKRPHAQMGTMVWITGTLAAMEVIKLVSGKWKPVVAPRYWHVTPDGARIARFGLARRLLSRRVQKPAGQALLPFLNKRPWLAKLFTRLIS
jgi:sulfur-carrier protein adenylyltransferase/sulfurtransferase